MDSDLHREKVTLNKAISQLGLFLAKMRYREKAIQSQIDTRKNKNIVVESDVEFDGYENFIQKQIRRGNDKQVTISDHAMIRYLQRHKGLDVDLLETEIKSQLDNAVEVAPCLFQKDGLVYVTRPDGFIKTILKTDFIDEDAIATNVEANNRFMDGRFPPQTRVTRTVNDITYHGHIVGDNGVDYTCRCFNTGQCFVTKRGKKGWTQI